MRRQNIIAENQTIMRIAGGYHGTFHHFSKKHMGRYVGEFAGRHNNRPMDTIDMMEVIAANMVGVPLRYRELVA